MLLLTVRVRAQKRDLFLLILCGTHVFLYSHCKLSSRTRIMKDPTREACSASTVCTCRFMHTTQKRRSWCSREDVLLNVVVTPHTFGKRERERERERNDKEEQRQWQTTTKFQPRRQEMLVSQAELSSWTPLPMIQEETLLNMAVPREPKLVPKTAIDGVWSFSKPWPLCLLSEQH